MAKEKQKPSANPPGEEEKKIREELDKMNYPSGEDIMNPASGAEKMPHHRDRDDLSEGLDVPGSELDDDMEDIGEEDEENNYYSLGGDKDD